MKVLILATSLNPRSRSRVLAGRANELCAAAGAETCLVELPELSLPFCGADGATEHPQAVELFERVREADGILIASPVYNYDVNAACKNAVELTGEAWENKVVGFMCTAGGQSSYMSVMSFANSLMLDFRCLIVPRFVYATGVAVRDGRIVDPEVERRLQQLCDALLRLGGVWPPRD
jgi:FMN reductase